MIYETFMSHGDTKDNENPSSPPLKGGLGGFSGERSWKMNLALSEEQEIIKRTARNFLAKECPTSLTREIEEDKKEFSPDIWQKMADMGWLGLVFPSEYGGSEGNFLDLTVLLEEMGRACAPSWFFSTVVLGAQTILDMGNEEQKERILPAVNRGKSLGTMATIEPQSGYDVAGIQMTSRKEADAFFLDGIKICVPDAHIADWLICVTRGKGSDPGMELFLIPKSGHYKSLNT